jgi:hypothetical protein
MKDIYQQEDRDTHSCWRVFFRDSDEETWIQYGWDEDMSIGEAVAAVDCMSMEHNQVKMIMTRMLTKEEFEEAI